MERLLAKSQAHRGIFRCIIGEHENKIVIYPMDIRALQPAIEQD
jgi:hypothetical protein